jgi:hypothetical protein
VTRPTAQLDTLLTPEEVAEMRGRSLNYLAKERTAGRGPRFIRDGRVIRYAADDVQAWLESKRVETADTERRAS